MYIRWLTLVPLCLPWLDWVPCSSLRYRSSVIYLLLRGCGATTSFLALSFLEKSRQRWIRRVNSANQHFKLSAVYSSFIRSLLLSFDLLVAALFQPSFALPGSEEARKLVGAPQLLPKIYDVMWILAIT